MKPNPWNMTLQSAQWLIFLLANTITIPIVIGEIYHLNTNDIVLLMQSTCFLVGISSFLQGFLGHRLPIADGPAGIWLGIFVISGTAILAGQEGYTSQLETLEGGMLITGGILIVLSITGLMDRVLRLFTPLVTGIFILLLFFQLSGSFFQRALGITGTHSYLNFKTAILSLTVVIIIFSLNVWGKGLFKTYSVIIGVLVGYIGYYALGLKYDNGGIPEPIIGVPRLLSWGLPKFQFGMALSTLIIVLVLISNIITSVNAMSYSLNKPVNTLDIKRGGLVTGFTNILAGIFSTVGPVPLSHSSGFIKLIGFRNMYPYLAGSFLTIAAAFSPRLMAVFSTVPSTIVYAVLLTSVIQMAGVGLQNLSKTPLNNRQITICGTSFAIGLGVMSLPPMVFSHMPSLAQYILGNGLILGTIIAILFELCWTNNSTSSTELGQRQLVS